MTTFNFKDINKKIVNIKGETDSNKSFEIGKRYINFSDIIQDQSSIENSSGSYIDNENSALESDNTSYKNSSINTSAYINSKDIPTSFNVIKSGMASESAQNLVNELTSSSSLEDAKDLLSSYNTTDYLNIANTYLGNSSTVSNLINTVSSYITGDFSTPTNILSTSLDDLRLTEWKGNRSKIVNPESMNTTTYANLDNSMGMAITLSLSGGSLSNLAGLSNSSSTLKQGLASTISATGLDEAYNSIASLFTSTSGTTSSGKSNTSTSDSMTDVLTATFYTILTNKPGTYIYNGSNINKTIKNKYKNRVIYKNQEIDGEPDEAEITDIGGMLDTDGEYSGNTYIYTKSDRSSTDFTISSDNEFYTKKKQVIDLVESKYNNQIYIGELYVEPYYSGSDSDEFNDPFSIPFEFNPKISEGGYSANYQSTDLLNRNLSVKSYIGSNSGELSLELDYVALTPDSSISASLTTSSSSNLEDTYTYSKKGENTDLDSTIYPNFSNNTGYADSFKRNYGSNMWQFLWSPTMIDAIEKKLRSLVLSTALDDGAMIKPPIVQIRMEDQSEITKVGDLYKYPISSDDSKYLQVTKALDQGTFTSCKRYVVTNVTISPRDDSFSNNFGFINGSSGTRVNVFRRGFKAVLTLSETTKNLLDLVPDYRAYYNSYGSLSTISSSTNSIASASKLASTFGVSIPDALDSAIDSATKEKEAAQTKLSNMENIINKFPDIIDGLSKLTFDFSEETVLGILKIFYFLYGSIDCIKNNFGLFDKSSSTELTTYETTYKAKAKTILTSYVSQKASSGAIYNMYSQSNVEIQQSIYDIISNLITDDVIKGFSNTEAKNVTNVSDKLDEYFKTASTDDETISKYTTSIKETISSQANIDLSPISDFLSSIKTKYTNYYSNSNTTITADTNTTVRKLYALEGNSSSSVMQETITSTPCSASNYISGLSNLFYMFPKTNDTSDYIISFYSQLPSLVNSTSNLSISKYCMVTSSLLEDLGTINSDYIINIINSLYLNFSKTFFKTINTNKTKDENTLTLKDDSSIETYTYKLSSTVYTADYLNITTKSGVEDGYKTEMQRLIQAYIDCYNEAKNNYSETLEEYQAAEDELEIANEAKSAAEA